MCAIIYFFFTPQVLIRVKMKKKRLFRSVFSGEGMEVESLLSPPEWFELYRTTCAGLLKIGTPSSHYRTTYFIYCAVITNKFSGDLEKVCEIYISTESLSMHFGIMSHGGL